MKRVISLLLCLVMCVSFFSATATPVYASGQTDSIFTVEKTDFENDRITYTISLAPNQKNLIGAIIKAEFDSSVLEIDSESGAVGSQNSYGEFVANVTGYYEKGITYDAENQDVYAVAYMNPNGFNIGANGKAFLKFVFKAVGEKRPVTDVEFYCEEYITEDENDDNDIRKNDGRQLIYKDTFFTLNPAKNVEVVSCVEGLKFTWTEAVGAEWYNIYRREADGEWGVKPYKKIDAGITEFVDSHIEKGKEYFYTVASANEYGEREYDETGLVGFDFGTIEEVEAELTERGALVSWSTLDYATSYTVYRQAEGETSWKKIADTTESFYEDEPLTTNVQYSYKVKAHHEKGYTADTSDEPAQIRFIANAVILEYRLNKNDIEINWREVDGAVGYEIYRKATGENDYTPVGTVEVPGFTDTDVEDRKEYSYQVRSLTNLETKEGSVRGKDSFDLIKLPITTAVYATLGGDNVTVSWDAVDLAESYTILRQSNMNGNWLDLTTVNAPQTKYVDRAVQSGKTYSYAIITRAKGMMTTQSDPSNAVYYLDAPTVAGVKNGSKGIEFSFNKVEGASAYNIYRRDVNGQFDEKKPIGTVSADSELVYVDSTAVSGGIYVYGVQSVYGDVLSGISPSSVICCLEEPKFTINNIYNGVQLNWNAVPSAEKYVIYYGISRGLETMKVLAETTSTSFVYNKCLSGRNNYFAVEAVCGETISTKTQQSIYYFASPVVELLEIMSNGVKVRWNIIGGAESYVLMRKASNETTWKDIATVKENPNLPYVQYTDTTAKSGITYKYTVKAYDGDEFSPYNTNGWSIKYLAAPTLKSVVNAYGGPQITWNAVGGATQYEVYRKTGSGKWTYIGSTKSTSYIDKTAKSDAKYYYAVRAVSGTTKSYYTDAHFNSICKSVNYLAAPVVKVANTTSTTIKVSWGKVGGAQKYEIYRKAGSAKKWKKIATTKKTSYTDKKVKNKTTYKYMVKAIDGKIVSAYLSSGVTIRCISAPKLSSVKSAKKGVTFKWNKVSGASGYYVYRKTGSGSYKKIATVKGGSKVSYLDKKAKKGKTYTYTVKAYYKSYSSAYRTGLKIKDKY